jgi:hypothetical protein
VKPESEQDTDEDEERNQAHTLAHGALGTPGAVAGQSAFE